MLGPTHVSFNIVSRLATKSVGLDTNATRERWSLNNRSWLNGFLSLLTPSLPEAAICTNGKIWF